MKTPRMRAKVSCLIAALVLTNTSMKAHGVVSFGTIAGGAVGIDLALSAITGVGGLYLFFVKGDDGKSKLSDHNIHN